MASSGAERMQAITAVLCAGGLLHPKQDPAGERPCALCRATADFLFGEVGVGTTLVQMRNELGVLRSQRR
jgi:hypothetical protein